MKIKQKKPIATFIAYATKRATVFLFM